MTTDVLRETEAKLHKYREYKALINELEAQIGEIMDKRDALAERALSAPVINGVRVMGGTTPDPVLDAVQKMADVYGKTDADDISQALAAMQSELDALTDGFIDGKKAGGWIFDGRFDDEDYGYK